MDWYHVQLFVWEKSVDMKMASTVERRLQLWNKELHFHWNKWVQVLEKWDLYRKCNLLVSFVWEFLMSCIKHTVFYK